MFPLSMPVLSGNVLSLAGFVGFEEVSSIAPVKSIIEGAIDFHLHSSPDVTSRSLDDFELAQMAASAGMRAIVLKNHVTSTADRAALANKIVPAVEIFGGIVLNRAVGGINPYAVESMYRMSGGRGKVVWLPTVDADFHLKVFNKPGTGLRVAQGDAESSPSAKLREHRLRHRLLPETEEVLRIVALNNLVLETGHISPEEVMLVIKRSRQLGVKNIVVTHAMADVPGLSLENMRECAAMGALLELDFVNDLMGADAALEEHRRWDRVSISQMVEAIRAIGAEHFILSTDLGRKLDPLPADGYKSFVKQLMEAGISHQEINLMMRENPARLLGIKLVNPQYGTSARSDA